MINILSSKYSFTSAKILRGLMEEISGERIRLTTKPERLKTVSVRYGNSFGKFTKDTIVNSPVFISYCANKLAFSKLLLENGFYTPEYKKLKQDLEFPVLIRETLSGSGGKGIILCRDLEEFNSSWVRGFWTKYIKTAFELRVHVLDGNIVRIFRKDEMESSEFPIRNNVTCHFSLKNPEKYPKLGTLISNLHGLFNDERFNMNAKFYALDIGWDAIKKEYFIFEANSAPGLNEHTANLYAEFILNNMEVT